MFCRKCGQEIQQGAKFCRKCGTPVQQPQGQPNMQGQPGMQPQEQFGQQPSIQAQRGQQSNMQQSQPDKIQNPFFGKQEQQYAPVAPKPQKSGGGKGLIIALICVFMLLFLGVAGFGGYYVYTNYIKEDTTLESVDDTEEVEETEEVTEEVEAEAEAKAETVIETETEMEIADSETETKTAEQEEEPAASVTNVTEAVSTPHTYQIVVKDLTWTEAYQEAAAIEGGYLVNIDTEEEWNTILQQIQTEQKENCIFWIGAVRRGESEDYFWVDAQGESVGESLNGHSSWLTGEPTYYDAENEMEERYVDMFYSSSEERWVWNDTPDDLISLINSYSGKVAYIVEIEEK